MKKTEFSNSVVEVKFGAWCLNVKRQIISDGAVEKELEPLLFKILSYLILNKESIITRQDLIDDVWCQKYVDDNAINRAISELRKVLKSDKQRGLVIKTHYRKGYSFFLEPEIIYYKEDIPSFSQVNILKEVPNKKQKISISLLIIVTLVIFISFYIALNVLEPSNVGKNNTLQKVETENLEVVKEKFKEEALSWRHGVYSRMILSPDNSTVALTLLEKEQLYSALLLKNLNSGQERKISEANANIFPAGWSIDSERVIYSLESEDKCELWEVGLTSNADSKFLFQCKPSTTYAINIGTDSFVYSKYGYRNRSELSVLVNRNLGTGEEFQISSPNLNSYGDKFLYFIKSKNKIIFERHQFNSSELYMTDLEGGAQIKLYETKNRIWSINYNNETDSLSWYDNNEKMLYQYSLKNNHLESKTKVDSDSRYSITYPIDSKNILGLTYPYSHNIYRFDLTSKNLKRVSKSISWSTNAIGENIVFLSDDDGESVKLNTVFNNGKTKTKKISYRFSDFKISSDSQEAIGIDGNGIKILNYEDLTVKDVITPKGNLISVNYLQDKNIGYIVQNEPSANSISYIFNRSSSNSILLPIKNAVWFGQLQNNKLVFLNNLDMLIFFDLSTGIQTQGFKVKKSAYKHSLSASQNKLYHSTGKAVYEYDFSESFNTAPKKVFEVNGAEDLILDVKFSSSGNILSLAMVELVNNELVRLSLEKSD